MVRSYQAYVVHYSFIRFVVQDFLHFRIMVSRFIFLWSSGLRLLWGFTFVRKISEKKEFTNKWELLVACGKANASAAAEQVAEYIKTT